ncbi:hypothetical protein V6259_13105 [Marinomonas sp. TI.3.20]|uniref:hypothetical protein n=1 Tax=Marinomonas sp. TI.3.20 TaxID=3121296 RepID=UPI00311E5B3C
MTTTTAASPLPLADISECENAINKEIHKLNAHLLFQTYSDIERFVQISFISEVAKKQDSPSNFEEIYYKYVRPIYMYRFFFNSFLSTEFFAEYFDLPIKTAMEVIEKGRHLHEKYFECCNLSKDKHTPIK